MLNRVIATALLSFYATLSSAQIVFEKGYFIDDNDQRTDCLIKNIDWKNNPTEFEYQITETDPVKVASIQSIKEFGVTGQSKYVRASVKIDRSRDEIHSLPREKDPVFEQETLFLKSVLEGTASLFVYENGNLQRFFYSVDGSDINQLVYKRWLKEDRTVGYNSLFRQQLYIDLKCSAFTSKTFEAITYRTKDIVRIFERYNECVDGTTVTYETKKGRDLFNLTIRPGINSSNLVIMSSYGVMPDLEMPNKMNFRFGVEAEFVLPYNKSKWSIHLEPTFQQYKAEETIEADNVAGQSITGLVHYKSLELPVGVRHYFFLNDQSKIFANASFIFDFSNNTTLDLFRNDGTVYNSLDIRTRNNLAFGVGYKHANRYSIEVRYHTNRELLGEYTFWNSDYKTLALIIGYSIF